MSSEILFLIILTLFLFMERSVFETRELVFLLILVLMLFY